MRVFSAIFKNSIYALILLFLVAMPARAETLNKVVAVVNGEIISMYDLQAASAPAFLRQGVNRANPTNQAAVDQVYRNVLDGMIADILITQEAERLKIDAPAEEVENEVRTMIQRSQMSASAFEQQLKTQGMTMAMVRDRIRKNILQHRLTTMMITRKIVVTQDDIRKYYDEHKAQFASDRSVELGMLVFPPEADANALLAQIHSGGATFEDVTAKWSVGPNAANGGSIGTLSWKELAPEWKNALEGLDKGGVSNLFSLPDGRQVALKVLEITPGRTMTIEEATPEIENRLREPKLAQRSQEYIKQLRDKAVVDIRL